MSAIGSRYGKQGGGHRAPAAERFFAKVLKHPGGCWTWLGAAQTNGYGSFSFGGRGRSVLAHRWSYEHHVGPVPPGLTVDHLCRNRLCVNPTHLEPVTLAENNRRGYSPTAINARKTACIHGHLLVGGNLFLKSGKRQCRGCKRIAGRLAYRRRHPEVKRSSPKRLPAAERRIREVRP